MAEELRFASREEVLEAIEDAFHNETDLDDGDIEVTYVSREDEMGCSIILSGEVGNETEVQVAEQIVTDVLGLPDVDNRLFVSESLREEAPGFYKRHHNESEDTDHMGETLELLEQGTIDDEVGYTPPDHPIPETTQAEDRAHRHKP